MEAGNNNSNNKNFCTVVNCMDGRVQLPVINYLQQKFSSEYVDTITEAGPVGILDDRENAFLTEGILKRVTISVERHSSVGIAVVAHHDCAGNPVSPENQKAQLEKSVEFLQGKYPNLEIIGLWVNDMWQVEEIMPST